MLAHQSLQPAGQEQQDRSIKQRIIPELVSFRMLRRGGAAGCGAPLTYGIQAAAGRQRAVRVEGHRVQRPRVPLLQHTPHAGRLRVPPRNTASDYPHVSELQAQDHPSPCHLRMPLQIASEYSLRIAPQTTASGQASACCLKTTDSARLETTISKYRFRLSPLMSTSD